MTNEEFERLEKVYKKALVLKENISGLSDYALSKIRFEEMDLVEDIIRGSVKEVRGFEEKIKAIQNHIKLKTNGMVHLNRETVITIIEKAVL